MHFRRQRLLLRRILVLTYSCAILGVSIPLIFAFQVFPSMQRKAANDAKSIALQALSLWLFFSVYWPLVGKTLSRQMTVVSREGR